MRIRAEFETLIFRRHGRFPSSPLIIQKIVHRRRARIIIIITTRWHGMRHQMYRLRCVLLWRQDLHIQRCRTREAVIIIRLATVAYGVPVNARVSGRKFHLHEANGTEAFCLEALVEIRIQSIHDLSRRRLFSAIVLRLSFLSVFRTEIETNLLLSWVQAKPKKSRPLAPLLPREDEEKLLRALLLAQKRKPSCSFAMKIYVQFNIE